MSAISVPVAEVTLGYT